MIRKVINTLSLATATLVLASTLTLAATAPITGTVSSVDQQGMVTLKDTAGKEHHVKAQGFKVGDKIECTTQGQNMTCVKPKA